MFILRFSYWGFYHYCQRMCCKNLVIDQMRISLPKHTLFSLKPRGNGPIASITLQSVATKVFAASKIGMVRKKHSPEYVIKHSFCLTFSTCIHHHNKESLVSALKTCNGLNGAGKKRSSSKISELILNALR